jgi:hypothetical protein
MTIQQREVLEGWYRRCAGNQHLQYVTADYYVRAHHRFGVPVIVLTAVVGTSVFASLERQPQLAIQIAIGLASVVASVLAGLQTFLRYGERADKHRIAGAKYGAVGRELEQVLGNDQPIAESRMDEIRLRLDTLGLESPTVPLFLVPKMPYKPEWPVKT